MKSRTAFSAALLSATASLVAAPSFAATLGATQVDNYFQADSVISLVALVLAASGLAAANVLKQKRAERLAPVRCYANANTWRGAVYQNLEAELQAFSSQFREAA